MAKKTAGVRVVAGSDAPFRGIVGEESGSGAASGGNGGEKSGTRGARGGDAGPCDGGAAPRLFGSHGLAPPPAKAGGGWAGVATFRADPEDTPRSEERRVGKEG